MEISAGVVRPQKKIKDGLGESKKEVIKLSLFVDDMIVYLEMLRNLLKKQGTKLLSDYVYIMFYNKLISTGRNPVNGYFQKN